MANRKITDLAALTAPATGDLLPIVDISEAAAADKNKKITFGELLASAPAGSAAAPSFSFDGDPNTGIYSPGADQLAISTGGTGRLFVSSAGNVGIGTSSPAGALHVVGATNGGQFKVDNTGLQYTGIDIYNSGTRHAVIEFDNTASILSLGSLKAGSSTVFLSNNAERARLDSSGRLLVGTSTANTSGAKLQTSDGLTFPATQVASSDPNTLDDYEEGTFTPTATPSTSGTITLSSITASYTKVGNTVSVRAQATVSAISSPLGYIDISLPFTNSGESAGSVFFYNGDTGAVMSSFIGRVTGSVFRITFGTGQTGASSAPYARANTEITISAVYRN